MAMLSYTAYFDLSGEHSGFPVISVAGAVAPVKKWIRFEHEWNAALNKEGIKEFHATDFAASRGEFKNWENDKPRRGRFLNVLGEIMRRNTNKFAMASMEMEEWDSVNKDYQLEEKYHSPYAMCGCRVVLEIKEWSRKNKRPHVEYIFEDGDKGWGGLVSLCELEGGITPIRLPKKKAIPCQAADLLAWKTRISCANMKFHSEKVIAARFPDLVNFNALMAESASLDKILVRPGVPAVFSRAALLRNCKRWGIPKRK
jgi:hypothetical protein